MVPRDRLRDHLADRHPGQPCRARRHHPRPLGHRRPPALGPRPGLRRGPVPGPHRQRPTGHGHLAEPRHHHLAAGRPRQHRRRPPPPRPPTRPATTNDHELLNDFAGALPAHSGRASQARSPGRRVHNPRGSQGPEDTPGTPAAHRHDLAPVPARASRHDARRQLLPRRMRDPPALVLLLRHRSRQPLRPYPRGHREPGRATDHSADPQSADGARRPRRGLPIPYPRPCRAVRRGL